MSLTRLPTDLKKQYDLWKTLQQKSMHKYKIAYQKLSKEDKMLYSNLYKEHSFIDFLLLEENPSFKKIILTQEVPIEFKKKLLKKLQKSRKHNLVGEQIDVPLLEYPKKNNIPEIVLTENPAMKQIKNPIMIGELNRMLKNTGTRISPVTGLPIKVRENATNPLSPTLKAGLKTVKALKATQDAQKALNNVKVAAVKATKAAKVAQKAVKAVPKTKATKAKTVKAVKAVKAATVAQAAATKAHTAAKQSSTTAKKIHKATVKAPKAKKPSVRAPRTRTRVSKTRSPSSITHPIITPIIPMAPNVPIIPRLARASSISRSRSISKSKSASRSASMSIPRSRTVSMSRSRSRIGKGPQVMLPLANLINRKKGPQLVIKHEGVDYNIRYQVERKPTGLRQVSKTIRRKPASKHKSTSVSRGRSKTIRKARSI